MSTTAAVLASVMFCTIGTVHVGAFVPAKIQEISRPQIKIHADSGRIEEVEFRIHPDGRVTETVRGIKGKTCQDVTEAINKKLGNVVATSPTEEMFEQEVLVDLTLQDKSGNGGWDDASSW